MGSPARSRFATQFVTLLQLQTCCWVHHNNQQSVQIFSKRGYQETLEDHRELEHVMKRRNVLDGKPRRPVKRPNTSSKIGENFYGRYRTETSSFLYLSTIKVNLWAIFRDSILSQDTMEKGVKFWLLARVNFTNLANLGRINKG